MISNSGGATMEGSKAQNLQQSLKKGPWTAAEDAILIEYVKKHGEGNWNSVQKNCGLMRCGKSCRLRWANHLRPNLKKGSFTPDEERIVIELHAKLGNKWARMASQLPGRTDNEIKNFWNTRMKRRQRAGLPIYPQEFHEEPTAIQQPQDPHKQPNSSSSCSFSSLISSRKAAYNPSLPLIDPINFHPALDIPLQNHFNNPFFSNATLQFKSFGDCNANNISLALPLSPVSQYARSPSSLSPLISQSFEDRSIPRTPPLLHYNNVDFDNNMSFTSLIMGAQVEPVDLMPSLKSEFPSNQTPPGSNTPSGGVCLGETASKNTENDRESALPEIQHNRNSGLLDALLLESHNLLSKEKLNGDNSSVVSDKGKRVADEITEEEDEDEEVEGKEVSKRLKLSSTNGSGDASGDDMSSSQSSIGMKPSEAPMEEMNSMDDDLLSLLDNFPSSTPLPEWYRKRNVSDGPTGEGGREVEAQQDDSSAGAATTHDTQNVEWGSSGSSYWNNMPSIC